MDDDDDGDDDSSTEWNLRMFSKQMHNVLFVRICLFLDGHS